MRTLNRNKQQLKYSLLNGIVDELVYDSDGNPIVEYTTSEGEIIYRKTGEKVYSYSTPVSFLGNIGFQTVGEAKESEFGIDISGYDAILVMNKGEIHLTETSIIWFENEPKYKDADETIVDGKSADFKVLQVKPSLNFTKYILGKVNK